jgi:hypothetical protein
MFILQVKCFLRPTHAYDSGRSAHGRSGGRLDSLEREEARLAEVVLMRVFAGMSMEVKGVPDP